MGYPKLDAILTAKTKYPEDIESWILTISCTVDELVAAGADEKLIKAYYKESMDEVDAVLLEVALKYVSAEKGIKD